MSFAFVFPGQGSQSVGMLGALATADSAVRATFDEASRVLGFDLWKLVSEGPEAALNATERTQPAMLAAGVAVWRVWRARGGALPGAAALARGARTAYPLRERGRCERARAPRGDPRAAGAAAVEPGALVGHPARSDCGRGRAGDRMRAGQGAHGAEPPYRAARGPGFSGAGGPGLHRGRTRGDPRGFPCLRTKSHSSPAPRAASGTPSRSPSERPARG